MAYFDPTPATMVQARATLRPFPDLRAQVSHALAAMDYDRATGRLTGVGPATVATVRRLLPSIAADVPMQFLALECWLACNKRPTDLAKFAARRLVGNSVARRAPCEALH
jgi:hypothetical protein